MAENAVEILQRYLEDAVAAERNFESQLRAMAKEGDQPAAQALFAQHAEETKSQHERLTARLQAIGGSPSTLKSFFAHIFNTTPKVAQLGHDAAEKSTQDLMIAFAVENAEVAMYEAMAAAANALGDAETEQLARSIQAEERRAGEKVFALIASSSRDAVHKITAASAASGTRPVRT